MKGYNNCQPPLEKQCLPALLKVSPEFNSDILQEYLEGAILKWFSGAPEVNSKCGTTFLMS